MVVASAVVAKIILYIHQGRIQYIFFCGGSTRKSLTQKHQKFVYMHFCFVFTSRTDIYGRRFQTPSLDTALIHTFKKTKHRKQKIKDMHKQIYTKKKIQSPTSKIPKSQARQGSSSWFQTLNWINWKKCTWLNILHFSFNAVSCVLAGICAKQMHSHVSDSFPFHPSDNRNSSSIVLMSTCLKHKLIVWQYYWI